MEQGPEFLRGARLVYLADAVEITYRSDKYDSVERWWQHRFDPDNPPTLALDVDSGTLIILGWGRAYDVTLAGITNPDEREPSGIPSLVARSWPKK